MELNSLLRSFISKETIVSDASAAQAARAENNPPMSIEIRSKN